MADTCISSQRSKPPESRTCVVSNVREVYIRDLAKKLAGKELVQSGLRRVKTVVT